MYTKILKLILLNSILFLLFVWSSVGVSFVIAQENTERLSIITKIEPNPYVSSVYKIPDNTFFNFSSNSKICPTNNCAQRFEDGLLFSLSVDSLTLSGTLKIEDKNTSNANIKNYRLLKTSGSFSVINIEKSKSNQITRFIGSLEIGKEPTNYLFDVIGILTLPSGAFILETEKQAVTNEGGTNVSIVYLVLLTKATKHFLQIQSISK